MLIGHRKFSLFWLIVESTVAVALSFLPPIKLDTLFDGKLLQLVVMEGEILGCDPSNLDGLFCCCCWLEEKKESEDESRSSRFRGSILRLARV